MVHDTDVERFLGDLVDEHALHPWSVASCA